MNPTNDEKSAFPLVVESANPYSVARGMSLRDWFAGMALQGILSNNANYYPRDGKEVALDAYAWADCMLAEREKEPR